MTLLKYATILAGIHDSVEPFRDGDYKSQTTGRIGYWASYQIGRDWLWYSVSDSSSKIILPSAVLAAIANGQCQRLGSFKVNGFEATVRFDGHSYMLGFGSKKPRNFWR
jgi:hypothetical protein